MKINENNRVALPWPAAAKSGGAPTPASRPRDGISLEGMAEARDLLRRLPSAGEETVDLERVAAVAAQLKNGGLSVSDEDLADAILDDLSTVMSWLSDRIEPKD